MNWLERKIEDFIQSVVNNPNKKRIPIGPLEDPTYWRWFVIPRNWFINIYLHNFLHDDAQDLHDHRAFNISFILQGSYFDEHFIDGIGRRRMPRPGQPLPRTGRTMVRQHRFYFRLPSWPHRVVLCRDQHDKAIPMWSLFIKFPDVRDWGFWCPGTNRSIEIRGYGNSVQSTGAHWIPWQQYVAGLDPTAIGYGQVGRGCDE